MHREGMDEHRPYRERSELRLQPQRHRGGGDQEFI